MQQSGAPSNYKHKMIVQLDSMRGRWRGHVKRRKKGTDGAVTGKRNLVGSFHVWLPCYQPAGVKTITLYIYTLYDH